MSNMPKGLPFFIIVWIIGIILGSTYDYNNSPTTWAGSGTGGYAENPQTTMNNLGQANQATQQLPLVGPVSFIVAGANFFMSLFKILTWQFSFVQNFAIVSWILTAFGVMGLASLVILLFSLIRGNVSWG